MLIAYFEFGIFFLLSKMSSSVGLSPNDEVRAKHPLLLACAQPSYPSLNLSESSNSDDDERVLINRESEVMPFLGNAPFAENSGNANDEVNAEQTAETGVHPCVVVLCDVLRPSTAAAAPADPCLFVQAHEVQNATAKLPNCALADNGENCSDQNEPIFDHTRSFETNVGVDSCSEPLNRVIENWPTKGFKRSSSKRKRRKRSDEDTYISSEDRF